MRVAEMGGEVAQIAGRALSDAGADVVRIEVRPRPGESARRRRDVWNLGKEVIHLPDGASAGAVLAEADVAVLHEDQLGALGVDLPEGARVVRATPFGPGPRERWRGDELTCLAATGILYSTGDPDRPPVRCSEPVAYMHAAGELAVAALVVVAAARPGVLEVSIAEAAMTVNLGNDATYPFYHDPGRRTGGRMAGVPEVWRCRDGHLVYAMRGGSARAAGWERLVSLVEDEHPGSAVAAIDWTTFDHSTAEGGELRDAVEDLQAFFAELDRASLRKLSADEGVLIAPVDSAPDVLANPHLRARGFFACVDGAGSVPRGAWPVDAAPDLVASVDTTAENVLDRWQTAGQDAIAARPGATTARPWDGLRILELGSAVAGPLVSHWFLGLGAACVRIESSKRVDPIRNVAGMHPAVAGVHPNEGSPLFANLNAGKQSVAVDLRSVDGRALAADLAAQADVVVENFTPGTVERLGLGYDAIRARNPRVVMLSSSQWGRGGPFATQKGYGNQGSAAAGLTYLTGWPDRPPTGIYPGATTDSLGAVFGAAAIAAALLARERTGAGAWIDLAQVEVGAFCLSPWLVASQVDDEVQGRLGTRGHEFDGLLEGVFACAGDDRWVAVSVPGHEGVDRLARLLGADPTRLGPRELRHRIAGWAATRAPIEAAARLQEVGVAAHPVADFAMLHADEHLAARRHYLVETHPDLGDTLTSQRGFRLGDEARVGRSPRLGEHTADVLASWLGLDDAQIDRLLAEEVLR